MALLRNISIGMTADTAGFTQGVLSASSALDQLNQHSLAAQSNLNNLNFGRVAGSAGGAGAAAGGAGADRGGMGDAAAMIAASMAPLATIGSRISAQLNAVGGTITTLARRIDAAIRFPATKRALDELQGALQSRIGAASSVAAGNLTRVQRVTLALGPAALTAIGAYRGFTNISTIFNTLTNRGDVARKSLDQLARIRYDTPAASATRLQTSLATITPTAARAATAVKGLGAQIGLSLGIVGVVYKVTEAFSGFIIDGVKGAANLYESMDKVREVFGSSAGTIEAQADSLSRRFNLLKGPILDAAGGIGLIGRGAGLTNETAATLATTMTQLAADATSLYNVPMEQSLEKIRSGLVGESEPLRQFGVLLSETAVKAEAQAMGLGRGKKELDEQSKVMARASLIQKGLTVASGNLEKTAGSAANQFRAAGGGVQNFATSVGAVLLPSVQSGVAAFNELLAALVTTFESNRGIIEGWATQATGALDLVGVVIRNFGDVWEFFRLSAVEKLSNVLAVVQTLPVNLGLIADFVAGNWKEMITDAVNWIGTVFQNLGKNLGNLWFAVSEFLSGRGFSFEWTGLEEGFKATVAKFPGFVEPEFISLQGEMDEVTGRIAAKEAARPKTAFGAGAAKPVIPGSKAAGDEDKYHGTAAAELGSKEAQSALAKFYNRGSDEPTRETAVNTKALVAIQKETLQLMKQLPKYSGEEVSLAIARL